MWYDQEQSLNEIENEQQKEEKKILDKFYTNLKKKKSLGSFISQKVVVGENLWDDQEKWRETHVKKFQARDLKTVKKKKLKKFYENQNTYVEAYQEMNKLNSEWEAAQVDDDNTTTLSYTDADSNAELLEDGTKSSEFGDDVDEEDTKSQKKKGNLISRICASGENMNSKSREFWEKLCIYISYACNIMLFTLKCIAAITSMSLTVITSTLDSALDLLSGAILFGTKRIRHTTKKNDWYKYPVGKARYEPVGLKKNFFFDFFLT